MQISYKLAKNEDAAWFIAYPAMNRRANIGRPSGTISGLQVE